MKRFYLISTIFLLMVNAASAQFIGDDVHGDISSTGDVSAGEIASASGIIGILHASLPYIDSATHEPWIQIGTRILCATNIVSVTPLINWYTAKLIGDSTTWVMDFDTTKPFIDGIPITPVPTTQWYTGDHSITNVTLDNPAYDGTLHIVCITDPDISHPIEWVEDYHYTTNKDDDGYITSVTPMDKWYIHTTFRFWYTKKQ